MSKKPTSDKTTISDTDTRAVLRRILKSIRPYRFLVALSLLLAVILGGFDPLYSHLVRPRRGSDHRQRAGGF